MRDEPVFQKRRSVFFPIIVTLIVFSICMAFILMVYHSIKQEDILEITDRYVAFENKVERLIYANVTLLQGYEAYIKTNPNLDEDAAYAYLENLLSENPDYIRNIGVIQDTTIIWNYPRESNAAAIGVDLSKIDAQKDLVLKVKTDLIPVLQGPIELVQGGSGFIVRLPIVMEDMGYWGQISIVLKSDEILEEISSYAESSELTVAIYNQENKNEPFFGSVNADESSTLYFNVDPDFINWNVSVSLPNVWSEYILLWMLSIVLSAGVSVTIGFLVYKYMKSNEKIFDMSVHDPLTGLHNRHYLDEYQAAVLSTAKRENRNAGVMLLDLNHFKEINDTYGHDVGDKVLVETSRILKKTTETDEVVFRWGGDEFLFVIPNIENSAYFQNIEERLRKAFEQEFRITGYPIKMTFSIGCALFPDDGEDIDALLHVADTQMYIKKPDRGYDR